MTVEHFYRADIIEKQHENINDDNNNNNVNN